MSSRPIGGKKPVALTHDAYAKFKGAVSQVRNQPIYTGRSVAPAPYRYAPDGFYARITAVSGSKYSWTAVAPGTLAWSNNTDWGSGDKDDDTGYAQEVTGSVFVPVGSIQWLFPTPGKDFWSFLVASGGSNIAIMKTSGSCTARSGDTLGAGNAYFYSTSTGTLTIVPGQDTPTSISNFFTRSILSGRYIQVCVVDGSWLVHSVNCEDIGL
jgi:hypothetical protein